MKEDSKVKDLNLKRTGQQQVVEPEENEGVSAGPIDKALELAFNPTREKIREVTIIDRMQGRLLPQLDVVNTSVDYVLQIATYRQAKNVFKQNYKGKKTDEDYQKDLAAYMLGFSMDKPEPPNLGDEVIYRMAQWQKSVAGKNLERITDIALAETETRGDDTGQYSDTADKYLET